MKPVIIEDLSIVPEVEKYLYERLEGVGFVDFNIDSEEGESLDQQLHAFIANKIVPLNPTLIIIPCSLGEYHTDYLGIRLGLHIRLSRHFSVLRYIPIVYYSPDALQDIIKFNPLAGFVGTPGTFLISDNIQSIQRILKADLRQLNQQEYTGFLGTIHFDPPGNYFSEHSIANEWGAYRLDKIAGTSALDIHDFPGMYTLYFKWLDSKNEGVIDYGEVVVDDIIKEETYGQTHVLAGLKPVLLENDLAAILKKNLESATKKGIRR